MNSLGKLSAFFILKIFLLPILVLLAVVPISCKKSTKNPCGEFSSGGLNSKPVYIFYIKKDFGGGPITVTIKDKAGNIVNKSNNQPIIKIYEPAGPVDPCNPANSNYEKRASFLLDEGMDYTYIASSENKGWKGEIKIPCDFQSCNLIELQ